MSDVYEVSTAARNAIESKLKRKSGVDVAVTVIDASDKNALDTFCNACTAKENEQRIKKGGAIYKVRLTFAPCKSSSYAFCFCGKHVGDVAQGIVIGVGTAVKHYYEKRLAAALKKEQRGD